MGCRADPEFSALVQKLTENIGSGEGNVPMARVRRWLSQASPPPNRAIRRDVGRTTINVMDAGVLGAIGTVSNF
jgi:hypothetical protein